MAVDVQTQFYSSVKAQATAQVNAYGQAGAQWLQTNTGVDANAQVNQQGAAAAQLFQNGYDPTNQNDNQAMVFVIAAGLNAIQTPPGIGTILSGALLTLYEVAKPMACPVAAFFHAIGISQSDCSSPPCQVNGPAPTPGSILSSITLPAGATQPGTFAQFVLGALAQNAASVGNCKSAIPPEAIVDAAVRMWNANHAGPAQDLYVPPLLPFSPIIPAVVNGVNGTIQNSDTGNVDPNIYYAFLPIGSTDFGDLAHAPPVLTSDYYSSPFYSTWGFPIPSVARTVRVNTGAYTGGASGNAAAGSSSTSSAIKHAAVAAGGGVAAGLLYAWVTGKAIDAVFGNAWGTLTRWAMDGVHAIEGKGFVAERPRKRRRTR